MFKVKPPSDTMCSEEVASRLGILILGNHLTTTLPRGGFIVKRRVLALIVATLFVLSLANIAAAAPTVEQTAFSDVSEDAAYAEAFAALKAMGVFTGYPDGTVRPADAITRAQFCKVVVEAMGHGGVAAGLVMTPPPFKDADQIPTWAWGYVNAAYALGIVKGDTEGNFNPNNNVLVQEAVTMLVRALGYEPWVTGGYPLGYMFKGGILGLDDDVELYSFYSVPLTRSDMAMMTYNALWVYEPYPETGKPWDSEKGEEIGSRWVDKVIREGVVENVSPMVFDTYGATKKYALADTVYLFGADSLDAVLDSEAWALRNKDGEIAFVKVPDLSLVTITGRVKSFNEARTEIKLKDGTIFEYDEDETDWTVNGKDFNNTAHALAWLDEWMSADPGMSAVYLTAFMDDDLATHIDFLTWNVGTAVVVDNDFDEDNDIYIFEIDNDIDGAIATEVTFEIPVSDKYDTDVDDIKVIGDVEEFTDVAADDVIRIATKNAIYYVEDTGTGDAEVWAVDASYEELTVDSGEGTADDFFRIEVARSTLSGTVDDVVLYSLVDGDTYQEVVFTDEDLDPVVLSAAFDDTIPSPGDIVTFSLDWNDEARHLVEYGAASEDFVWVVSVAVGSTWYINVDDEGEALKYKVDDATWTDFDTEGRTLCGKVVQLEVGANGKVTDVAQEATQFNETHTFTIKGFNEKDGSVVIKETYENTSLALLAAMGPVIYDGDEFVGIGGLKTNMEVHVYTADGEIVYLQIDVD